MLFVKILKTKNESQVIFPGEYVLNPLVGDISIFSVKHSEINNGSHAE